MQNVAVHDESGHDESGEPMLSGPAALAALAAEVVDCARCERLVAWRTEVARTRRAAYRTETYWGAPVPGFGDPQARLLVLGLAPAAHGANRTGRMFTGDRSGDWLIAALYRAGLASQPTSTHRDDGLTLIDTWITSAVKCAPPGNTPTPQERQACSRFVAREIAALAQMRVVVCLGAVGWAAALQYFGVRPRPRFGHGVQVQVAGPSGPMLIGCYHPSQQNTFTGRLTEPMLDAVFSQARRHMRGASTPQ